MKILEDENNKSFQKINRDELKILLVEDNLGDIRLIQEMIKELKGSRFNLQYTTKLSTALETININQINLILLDLSLPDSHGINTIKNVIKGEINIPIIILTGNDDLSLAIDAVRLGAEDYLVKGQVNAILLERSINYAIERHKIKKKLLISEQNYHEAIIVQSF